MSVAVVLIGAFIEEQAEAWVQREVLDESEETNEEDEEVDPAYLVQIVCVLGNLPQGHNYIRHNSFGHNYIGHNYIGHNYIDHEYI